MIMTPGGEFPTNSHVVQKVKKLKATLAGGSTYPARLVGDDPATDLAVITVLPSSLPVADLGDSD